MINPDQPQRPLTAKNLLLDLMRASAPGVWPVKELIEVGRIFGINENALRVNITRLVSKGLLEQDERGRYRLLDTHDPLREWLHRWHQGEARVVPWQGDWLTLSVSPTVGSKHLKNIEQACMRLGFRQLWQRQWLRPNNLAIDLHQLSAQIFSLVGEDAGCEFMLAESNNIILPGTMPALESLWSIDRIEANYRQHINVLQQSINTLADKSADELLRDTFILGGEVIHLLSLDPLLPEALFDVSLRQQLTQLMKEYDQMGKPYWVERFQSSLFNLSPSHIQPSLQRSVPLPNLAL
ncbi:MAG TPA: hypothetical protein ENI05_15230 [Porticoccus sp.]|nr:hypothetical protein [Porticoccus sp.]